MLVLSGCFTPIEDDDVVEELQKANCFPLPSDFIDMGGGEGSLGNLTRHTDILFNGGYLFNGKLYCSIVVEYHYRNDETRHLWGTPSCYETTLPSQKEQAAILLSHAIVANAKIPQSIMLNISLHEYNQGNGQNTDDRHVLEFWFEYEAHKKDNLIKMIKELSNV
jgi:hypothetical protein